MLRLLITLLFIQYCVSAAYTIEDLRVLNKSKSYKEYLDHMKDIRPSKRDNEWKKMTLAMATGYIKKLVEGLNVNDQGFSYIEGLNQIPLLKEDGIFQLRRTQFAIKYFEQCPTTNRECKIKFLRFTKNNSGHIDLDYRLYQMAKIRPQLKRNILLRLTKSSVSNFYCKKERVYSDLLGDILGNSELKTISDYQKYLNQIANKQCSNEIVLKLYKEVLASKDNTLNNDKIMLLLASKSLEAPQEDLILISFILNGPIVGEVFNTAWNRLQSLSKDYARRETLLSSLTKNDLLLGSIFSHPDKKKREVIIKQLNSNFPEYINSYAKQCVSYYSGTKEFPYGNPTPDCNKLMDSTKNSKVISDYIRMKYSSAKKFK